MRSGVAQALRPRVWHDCALFFFDLGISYFAGFGTRLGRILTGQNRSVRAKFYKTQGGVNPRSLTLFN
jgi:hypothetical protein